VIARHISNIFKDGELERNSVYAKFAYTAADGKTYQVAFYNLDVVISVGYPAPAKPLKRQQIGFHPQYRSEGWWRHVVSDGGAGLRFLFCAILAIGSGMWYHTRRFT